MRDSKVKLTVVVLLAVGLVACQRGQTGGTAQSASTALADPRNPLIGRWRFNGVGGDATSPMGGCASEMTFTATRQTLTYEGTPRSNDVTYNASPTLVYVMGNTGIVDHVTYKVLDANHVELDAAGPCDYVRTA